MRIGIDARALRWPGIGRFIRQLVDQLDRIDSGHELVIYLPAGDDQAVVAGLGSRWTRVTIAHGIHSIKGQIVLASRCRSDRLDVFHATTSLSLPLAAPVPLVVTVHDLLLRLQPRDLHSPLGRLYFRAMNRLALQRARILVAVSDFTAAEIARLYPAFAPKVRRVYNGVSPAFQASPLPSQGHALGETLGIPGRFLLYVGTLKPHKNVPTLIRAFGMLAETRRQSLTLVLVTRPDPRYTEVPRLIERLGLGAAVRLASGLSDADLACLYQSAEALVMPSEYEGFGLPLLEAMAAGTAVVASDIPVFHELAGPAAVYFDPRQPERLAAVLERLLGDDSSRAALAVQGRARAARFSWERTAAEMLAIYAEVASG
jgi:alpha-1,3-rhamnosyl/mannosyltransferase